MLAVWSALPILSALVACGDPFGRRAPPPNVLWIVWDTVRADRTSVGSAPPPVDTTPRLAAFAARRGVVYTRATSPATWTLPSHASLFTGQHGPTHGADASWRWVDEANVTLAEQLRDAGWATFAFSANPYVSPVSNVLQGFDEVELSWGPRWGAATRERTAAKQIDRDASTEVSPAWPAAEPNIAWGKSPFKEAAPVAHAALVDWLGRRTSAGPWFAYLNLMEAHSPRLPSKSARRRVMDRETYERGLVTDVSLFRMMRAIVGDFQYSDAELAAIRANYDAALTELDDATGDLLDDLEARGLLDDTIVIVTSDHGENLGDHGLWEHRYSIHQTMLHVPLVVSYPRALAPGRVDRVVSTVDLHSTVLDWCGLDAPGPTASRSLTSGPAPGPVYALLTDPFASSVLPIREALPNVPVDHLLRTWEAVLDGDDKLVRASDGSVALYDLLHDPDELVDRSSAAPERVRTLTGALDRWRAAVPVADPARRTPKDLQHDTADDETAAKLKLLGYVE
ncbi:MAG: sulfatase [Myxococcota bacterium]